MTVFKYAPGRFVDTVHTPIAVLTAEPPTLQSYYFPLKKYANQ